MTLTMATVTWFFTIRQLHDRRRDFDNQMRRVAESIASMKLIERQSWSDYQDYVAQLMSVNDDIVYIALYDDRGWLHAHALNWDLIEHDTTRSITKRIERETIERIANGLIAEENRDDFRAHEVNILSGERVLGSVQVGFSLIKINSELDRRIRRNVIMALLFIAASSLLAIFISQRISGPLERLTLAMSAISKGDYSQRVRVESRDEIGILASTYNEMAEGLRERAIFDELGIKLGKVFQLGELAEVVHHQIREAMAAEKTLLFLKNERRNGYYVKVEAANQQGTKGIELNEDCDLCLHQQRQGILLSEAPPVLVKATAGLGLNGRDFLLPMFVKDELTGLLIFAVAGPAFNPKQRQFAITLANQAGLALENVLLYEKLREQERLKRELEIAREVQQRLLPKKTPKCAGFTFDAVCEPAMEVGGDYFDFFEIGANRFGIAVGDVSGKGTAASFYMAEIKGMMSMLAYRHDSPKQLMCELNEKLYSNLEKTLFATMIYGLLDSEQHLFAFVRAGHTSVLHILADGKPETLTPPGIGLGLDSGALFKNTLVETEIRMQPGSKLLLFTDGITEAMNGNREEFGDERLLQIITGHAQLPPKKLRTKIFSEIQSFAASAVQHDDLTMVIVQRNASTGF